MSSIFPLDIGDKESKMSIDGPIIGIVIILFSYSYACFFVFPCIPLPVA